MSTLLKTPCSDDNIKVINIANMNAVSIKSTEEDIISIEELNSFINEFKYYEGNLHFVFESEYEGLLNASYFEHSIGVFKFDDKIPSARKLNEYKEIYICKTFILPKYVYGLFKKLKCSGLYLNSIITTNTTVMANMFTDCDNLTTLDISYFDTSNVEDMANMFKQCGNLKSLDLSNFDTSNVKDMSGMFSFCRSLTSLNLSNFNTSKVEQMIGMFQGCRNLTSLDLSNFNLDKIKYMNYMFDGCKLKSTDIKVLDEKNYKRIISQLNLDR